MADTKISGATALNTTGLLYTPVAKDGVTTAFKRVDQISASSSPTVNDDVTTGYHAGSFWYRIDTNELFICRSSADGAAVWTKLSTGIMDHYIAGNYYNFPQMLPVNTASSVVTAIADTIKAFPFRLARRISISHLTYRVGTQNANLACAIYNSNATTGLPTTALASNTASAVGAIGATREFALSAAAQIEAGVTYWAAMNFSGSTATVTDCGPGGMSLIVGGQLDGSIGAGGTNNAGVSYSTQTCGTWNDLTAVSPTAVVLSNDMPMMGFKCSAVP